MVRRAAAVPVVALCRPSDEVFTLLSVTTALAQLAKAGVATPGVTNAGLLMPQSLARLSRQVCHHVEPDPADRLNNVVAVRLAGSDAKHLAAARVDVIVEAGTVVLLADQVALRLAHPGRLRDLTGTEHSPVLAAARAGHQGFRGLSNQ